MGEKPKEKREADAEKEAGDEREVEGGVLAAMNDVAGEAAKAHREFAAEIQKRAYGGEQRAKNEKGATELAERIHARIIEEQAPPSTVSKCVAEGINPDLFSGEELSGISLWLQK